MRTRQELLWSPSSTLLGSENTRGPENRKCIKLLLMSKALNDKVILQITNELSPYSRTSLPPRKKACHWRGTWGGSHLVFSVQTPTHVSKHTCTHTWTCILHPTHPLAVFKLFPKVPQNMLFRCFVYKCQLGIKTFFLQMLFSLPGMKKALVSSEPQCLVGLNTIWKKKNSKALTQETLDHKLYQQTWHG